MPAPWGGMLYVVLKLWQGERQVTDNHFLSACSKGSKGSKHVHAGQ